MKVTLNDLRPGAIFVTDDGTYAVKVAHHRYLNEQQQFLCVSLSDGSFVHFPDGNSTLVEEVGLYGTPQEEQEEATRTALAELNEAWHACELAAQNHSSDQFRLCMKRLEMADQWFKRRSVRVYYDQNKAEHFLSGNA